jgi:hypothetical protein
MLFQRHKALGLGPRDSRLSSLRYLLATMAQMMASQKLTAYSKANKLVLIPIIMTWT